VRTSVGPIVLVTLVLVASAAHAASVTGTFVEKGARTPLAGVEVVLRSAADSSVAAHATTGSDGSVRIDSLRFGRYLLRASLLGHAPYLRSDVILSESAPVADLGTQELAVSAIAIKGVETATARGTAIVGSDRNIYLAKDIPAGTATELLRAVPELEVDINDRISLRGSSSVTIQLNGRTSPLTGDALAAFLRQYPASRIERVEVIANPSAKYDPEGMAGIVNIVTKEQLDLGLSGSTYLTFGDKGGGPGARVAWQQGRLTLYGGVSGYWNHSSFRNEDARDNLLALPPSSYRYSSDSRNRSGFGNSDASMDLAFDKRSTLYATLNGYVNDYRSDALNRTSFADEQQGVLSSYERQSASRNGWRSGSATLGFQHVVEKSRNEWSVELRHSESPNSNSTDAVQHLLVPVESTGQVSEYDADGRSRDRSAQFDDTWPLGKKGKLELGYRAAERRNATRSTLEVISGEPGGGLIDYVHRELFQSGYLTAGTTVGRLSVQAGLRGEAARTTFDVRTRAASYENDYRSVFPSANVAWDFGAGRTLRLTWSKRIERPSPGFLNPDVPTLDTLNRTVGNPFLAPKYTYSYSLEASWAGSRGLLRLAPFYRETIRNWDLFKTVDARGVAITTWLNASSIRFVGSSVVASLRQTGRVGGTLNLSVYREIHDASNLSQFARRDATVWSVNGNVTWKLTKALDLQSFARYNPAQTLAQGRISGVLFSNIGGRWKFNDRTWASLYVSDPFKLWKYEFVTSDASYTQRTTNRGTIRGVSLSFGWSWGKPPETKQRRQSDEPPPQDQTTPGR
jgi:outer membrane receptor for ferrienterochelin and colicin